MSSARTLSTAEARRSAVVSAAIATFAQGGYYGTTIADVAKRASISPAYVSKLFSSKSALFVAALDEAYERIVAGFEQAAAEVDDPSPESLLMAMSAQYAEQVADRELLMLQVHAQAATAEPEIVEGVRRGIGKVVDYAASRTRVDGPAIQNFIAFGQLCHVLTTVDAFNLDEPWAKMLTAGMLHHDSVGGGADGSG